MVRPDLGADHSVTMPFGIEELLAHATLWRRVWGPGYETQTGYTPVYVGRLRTKLGRAGDAPLFITEPRSGYRFATS